jgi:glycosyltransferase involved in cell wall biosynthesis
MFNSAGGGAVKILVPSIVDLKKCAPNRLHHFINHLSEKHEITAICVNDCWKAEKVDTGKSYKDFDNELGRINIEYITKWNVSPFYQEFLLSRLIGSKFKDDYDVIFNYNTLLTGNLTAQKSHIPMVYDLADDLPEMVASSPQIPRFLRGTGKMFASRLLAENLLNAKKVTGISKTLQASYAIPGSKFELVNNGVNTRQFRPLKTNLKSELDLEDFFVLGYVGVLREWVDFKPVYEALKYFEDVRLLIVGEEGLLKENIKLAEAYGVAEKVLFTGTVPYASVPEYISAMDCCLIPFNQSKVSQNSVPLKLFEYMACEKPVLSTRLPGVKEVAGGRVLYADTAEEYKEQIANVMSSDSGSERLKSNRRFVVDNYDWKSISRHLEAILEDAI